MHDELTKVDIEKMQQELDHRRLELRPKLIEEVQIARSFGDLSENFEYKAAKREKNRNDSRIRYLERMIKTAVVIEDTSADDEVGLFDTVTVFLTDEQEEEIFRIVTTLRQNPLKGLISKESPIGSALMGKKVGDIVHVQVNERFGYDAKVIKIEKGTDDEDLPIMKF
ncbi:MAG: transcription elongation factor GreA [Oscillospiraceae bacterium]|nr:transcription elongation factor GreA [Oscillospiraceae bacterium]